jgi:uncharacterized protein (TIGR02246 family)
MAMSPQSMAEVQQLIAGYAEYVDEGDLEGYANQFTEDGVFENRSGRLEGREAIREWVATLIEAGRVGGKSSLRHVLGLPVIRGDDQQCTARTYVMIPGMDESGEVGLPMVGTYRDAIVKIDGKWYFRERSIVMDLSSESHSRQG